MWKSIFCVVFMVELVWKSFCRTGVEVFFCEVCHNGTGVVFFCVVSDGRTGVVFFLCGLSVQLVWKSFFCVWFIMVELVWKPFLCG